MTPLTSVPRLVGIARVLLRYRLDEMVEATHLFRPLRWIRPLFGRPPADLAALSRGARLRLALAELGPIFVKFGQILSTRRDLLPADIADELVLLQDQVPPYPGAIARAAVESSLGAPVATLYARFDEAPLASASIAQVHAAQLHDGREVVVKVLRPGVGDRIARDVSLLEDLAGLVERFHPNASKIRPRDVVAEIETTLVNELDLQREGANASLLRRNFKNSPDLYVPEVHWSHTRETVLTMERVRGIPVDDIAALDAAGIDRVRLAEKGVQIFYTQVFRDNFFHADAHAGNIWVDPANPREPRFIALDFGIMGSLPEADQYWLAENFIALFNQDYAQIARLHVAAGWMPSTTRIEELEAATRAVCEPYFTRPLSEISLAEVLVKLFQTARRYELTLQPQLILLQKTLLNIEGIGRQLHPRIDIWAVAKPVLERVWRERRGPKAILKSLRRRIPEWLAAAPDMPQLLHDYLQKASSGGIQMRVHSEDLRNLHADASASRAQIVPLALGATLILSAVLLYALDATVARFAGVPFTAWLAAIAGTACFWLANRRS
ncbi:ubiquinone biosynthesis regulatory protein kinase UbiB [Tahibacter soli]|uniref:Ubiquinone biosynthesis regulatory protein kinase UbiB n=1 Tax=Tahibacter soli TaxID=2983605 RepID=A0A9X4BIT3_9GAMM|nr:ubiquinone biosynthesis regulatory protein kinase UbiB [Tahibacter soli]MDC8014336.1 ubiquinone biosynthesis regulatory protein kinase UbiB [Tahibacter soli]